MTKEKLKDNLDWMDAPIKATQWRALVFVRDGSPRYGRLLHNTENECAQSISNCEYKLSNGIWTDVNTLGGPLLAINYSHAIPMPVANA